jgi:hypothetical protein
VKNLEKSSNLPLRLSFRTGRGRMGWGVEEKEREGRGSEGQRGEGGARE